MTVANQLVRQLAVQRQGLRQLEERLHQLQSECDHQFKETPTQRECEKCKKVESVHY
ncbi:hypothetical protein [Sporosarcina obsidiansis]|uniref:hypothetical protein n=1 Tax=Sporosarcina obsidiansis TaxID=2660748 RepID=UPI00129ABB37|nr:hypothetical protein [Sporosarcina obsidiansis]